MRVNLDESREEENKVNLENSENIVNLENSENRENLENSKKDGMEVCDEIKIEMEELIEPGNLLMLRLKEEDESSGKVLCENFFSNFVKILNGNTVIFPFYFLFLFYFKSLFLDAYK